MVKRVFAILLAGSDTGSDCCIADGGGTVCLMRRVCSQEWTSVWFELTNHPEAGEDFVMEFADADCVYDGVPRGLLVMSSVYARPLSSGWDLASRFKSCKGGEPD